MREIKFRGFNNFNNGWIYGSLVEIYEDCHILKEGKTFFDRHTKVDKDSIGQYTGLKDKYNTEIYEGDILELTYFDDSKAEMYVSYLDDLAKFILRDLKEQNKYFNIEFFDKENIEVIGNIFENKELLKLK